MLQELHVQNLALISDAWLEFGPGMTALTGETGAGKTALLGALKLLLGERADSTLVRNGASEALVEGRFTAGEDEVVARRKVSSDGRSRCTLDGEMATVGALAERLGPLVDLHGQHEHQALLTPGSHVAYLDRWAGEEGMSAIARYRAARAAYRGALAAKEVLADQLANAARNADYLHFVADEIGRVAPVAGEDDALSARLPALQHAERLAEAAGLATELLRGDEGALDRIGEAAAVLSRVEGIDPDLDALVGRLAEARALVDDASADLRGYRDGVEHDPSVLDSMLTRLGQLNALARKYGPRLQDVIRTREEALVALAAFESGEEGLSAAQSACAEAESELRTAAAAVSGVRKRAEAGFVGALGAAAADLAMDGACFEVSVTDLPFDAWTADGPHRVEFLYAPASGLQPRPLARIASGGEISRVMLALKGVLGEADTVETLVFDEVDAGIGGTTADAVGRRLAQLARTHQVIIVTHLAQVAAYADSQMVVAKHTTEESVATTVEVVYGEDRIAEIARMLSGRDSEASRLHARELLGSVDRPL
ncbi:MAG: DNA repair protein RecN [Coriobacteriia bacterium]|nr:DNA repair protein RecN [Coriobacteriia bacterium]